MPGITLRRRRDGIYEIARHSALRTLGFQLAVLAGVLGIVLVLMLALVVALTFAMPLVVVAGAVALRALWVGRRRRPPPRPALHLVRPGPRPVASTR
jgi:hypothetical protein